MPKNAVNSWPSLGSVVQARLFRLMVVIAVLSFVGGGGAAGLAFYKYRTAQRAVVMYSTYLNDYIVGCEKDRQSVYCEVVGPTRREFESAVVDRNTMEQRWKGYAMAALIVPIGVIAMFLAGAWVVTGRRPWQ